MPSKELCKFVVGTHEIKLSCCGGPGKCESGGGVLKVTTGIGSEGTQGEVSTCLPWSRAAVMRAGMNEMLVAMANAGPAEERSARLRGELTALNLAVNKIREELSVGS